MIRNVSILRLDRFKKLIEEIHNDYGYGIAISEDSNLDRIKETFKNDLIKYCFDSELNESQNEILRKIDAI